MSTTLRGLVGEIRRLRSDRAPAFIAGIASNGLSYLRSLGRQGISVVALDFWKDPGMYSRYCRPAVVPDPEENEDGLLDLLRDMGEAVPVRSVLIPTSDAFVLFVSKHSRELANHYDFNVADHEAVLTLANKRLQYEYAESRGIKTPLTRFPEDVDIEEIALEMDYPCIIKPYFSHLWRHYMGNRWGKVAEVQSARELLDTYAEMEGSGLELMVQQKIPGGDDQLYGLLTYLDRSSEPRAIFTKRKLRQFPRNFGDGSLTVGVWDSEVAELGLRLLQGLKFRGAASVEFKRDAQDGQLKLMEVNPRSISQTHHAVVSGVDIPFIAYQHAIGNETERAESFREGVKWIDFTKDFGSLVEMQRAGNLDLGRWLRSWRGDRCFAFFTWDDPLPAFLGFSSSLWSNVRKGGGIFH